MRCFKLAVVFAILALGQAPAFEVEAADAPTPLAVPCGADKCRPAEFWVRFNDTDGKLKESSAANLAYTNLEKGTVTAVLGETLTFNAESDGKALSNITLAQAAKAAGADPAPLPATVDKGPGQIVMKFVQPKDPKTHSRLVATHNFAGNLAFDAYVLAAGATEYKQSPTCPTAEGKSGSTEWYSPILAVTLVHFSFVKSVEPNTATEIICQ